MVFIASSESCEPKRFSRYWSKVERKYIQEQQPNQFHCYNKNIGFANRMDQSVVNYRIGIRMKTRWCSPFVWMVDVVLQGSWVLYRVNKDEGDESLLFLVFRRYVVNAIFLKYSEDGRLSTSHVGIQNISSDTYYEDTKHYQVQSEHRLSQNLFKHLSWVNALKSLTGYTKTLHPRCLKGSEFASAEK